VTGFATGRTWRNALGLAAVLALAAGVVIGTWFRPPATTITQTPVQPEVVPQTASGTPASEAAPHTDATPPAPAAPAGSADISLLRGRALTLPVSGMGAGQLSDTYSQARAAGAPHEAIDIMAPRGTPVLAVEDGRVVKLFLSKPGGVTLYQFDPDSNYAYYYAHLDRYADGIAEGVTVRKGQVIAYVGSTGNASPDAPHRHFAIFKLGAEKQWWRGVPLNPFLVWRDARR
jgi:murein DD-endopeptidase MepM/ murein hydrolase activator NlpD